MQPVMKTFQTNARKEIIFMKEHNSSDVFIVRRRSIRIDHVASIRETDSLATEDA